MVFLVERGPVEGECGAIEELLKNIVLKTLEEKLGFIPNISAFEWNEARRQALDDLYVNKLCFYESVDVNYFANTMALILKLMKT